MPLFTYKAKANPGEIKAGTIEADNKAVAIKVIRQSGLYPVYIRELTQSVPSKDFSRVNNQDLSAFTRQLANLVRSGFTLSRALSTLTSQTHSQNLKRIIENLQEKIRQGFTFSQALSSCPKVFSDFYVNMVRIGEAGGRVDSSLERLAEFKEREQELTSQVKSALAYPALLFIIGIITIFVLVSFVIPRLVVMFANLGQELPLPTQMIIQLSGFMHRFWWLFLAAAAAVFIFGRFYYRAERNRITVDSFILRLPWIRSLIQKLEVARFSYALGVLLENGVSMLESLGVVTLSVQNRVFRKKITDFAEKIRQGQSLSSCMEKDPLFPPLLINMVGVGEESGELPQMLLRIASAFEKEVNRTIKVIVSLLEPALILAIGSIVGLIVLSMLLPVFQMNILIR
ncbi:type II secretion system F family protein [Candidatus Omnitrophota bacterium]